MKYSFILFLFFIGLTSCSDQSIADDQKILDYLAEKNLTAEKTEDGLYYIIDVEGDGVNFPNINNTVTVNYKGYLTDGTVFDENDELSFGLWQVIEGWKKGIPLISTGGSATLIIPSEMGYGENGTGVIPGNAVLVFEVDLISFI